MKEGTKKLLKNIGKGFVAGLAVWTIADAVIITRQRYLQNKLHKGEVAKDNAQLQKTFEESNGINSK